MADPACYVDWYTWRGTFQRADPNQAKIITIKARSNAGLFFLMPVIKNCPKQAWEGRGPQRIKLLCIRYYGNI